MRNILAIALLSTGGLIGCAGAPLPAVEDGLSKANDSLHRAEAVYAAVCVPPIVPEMGKTCEEIAKALAVGGTALEDVGIAYEAVKPSLQK
jgi:hypothetical protein